MSTSVASRPRMKRIGHKGADTIAPGNTAASFDAALDAGVDVIEFDILARDENDPAGSELVLCHDYDHLAKGRVLTLEEGLDHLCGETFGQVDLDVDLKLPGYELRALDALRERGLLPRTMISTHYLESLDVIRAAEPSLKLGWSVPNLKRDYAKSPLLALPALLVLQVVKLILPGRVAKVIRAGRADALMVHWRLLNRRLVEAVHGAGGEIYVWTVDDEPRIRKVEALGVDGIISNDPRLFGAGAAPSG